jgi:hypothetical protein
MKKRLLKGQSLKSLFILLLVQVLFYGTIWGQFEVVYKGLRWDLYRTRTEDHRLGPEGSTEGFGDPVALSGDVAIVGDHTDCDLGTWAGAAHIYRYDGTSWVSEQKLLASDGATNDIFDAAVAISGDVAIIEADLHDHLGTDAGAAYIFRYDGSTWIEEQELLAPDGVSRDEFGRAVSISGNVAVVGAQRDSDMATDAGSAYIYRYDGVNWIYETELYAFDPGAGDLFGMSVSISGDVVVVGSSYHNEVSDDEGAAYIYRYDGLGWREEAKLVASDPEENDSFGKSVSASGDVVVVGADYEDDAGSNAGAAYIFRYDGADWLEEKKLRPYDARDIEDHHGFGRSVAVAGDYIVVGADGDDEAEEDAGAAYLYRYDGARWSSKAKFLRSDADSRDNLGLSVAVSGDVVLVGGESGWDRGIPALVYNLAGVINKRLNVSDGAPEDRFGSSVSVSGNAVLTGAYMNDDLGLSSGSAYIHRFDGPDWLEEAKLLAHDGDASDWFGYSVALSGDVAVVGSPQDDDLGLNSGSAYIFRYDGTTWVEEAKLLPKYGDVGAYFGFSVAISGDVVVIGAYKDDELGTDYGSAYIFRYDGSNWYEEAKFLPYGMTAPGRFGHSVSIAGDVVVIGAERDDDLGEDSGSAYVYRYNGLHWKNEAKLLAPDGTVNDYFGTSVSISGDVIVVGMDEDDDLGSLSGSAYIFRYDGMRWIMEEKLLASDGGMNSWFGCSVSNWGDVTIIGAMGENWGTAFAIGAAYIFRYDGTTWVEEDKLQAFPGYAEQDYFGRSVSVCGGVAAVGADNANTYGPDSGKVNVFDF